MKKSYLMRNFNWVENLIFLLILGILIDFLLKFGQKMGVMIFPEHLKSLFDVAILNVTQILKILVVVILLSMIPEIMKRLMKDKLKNLAHSIHGTLVFRRFLKQYQSSASTGDGMISITENYAISKFNRSVHHAVLELSESEIRLYIKVPQSSQAQKILKEHEVQIKEEISNLYPEYLISTFERRKHHLWLMGTKRK